ncbi:MAG TPA: LysM domain-containing protein [Polyangiaceae bacterium]|nr:LysM domain-containing protein [Polyangiaceae bacterium]
MTTSQALRCWTFAVWLLGFVCCAPSARAFTHVVQTGDTLASIAEKYYGKIQYERILVAANLLDLEGGSSIVRGMRLEVPALGHRRIMRGDTWEALAAESLGAPFRSDVLALANDSMPWLLPEDGAEIVIPYNLRLIVRPNETLIAIALKFMGEMNKAWILDRYNKLGGRGLTPGTVLLVPLADLPLTAEGRKAAALAAESVCSQAAGDVLRGQRKLAQEIPLLIHDVRAGRYVEAVSRGNRFLAAGTLTEAQLAVVQRQLLEAYVALDAAGLARAACNEWRKREPHAILDPVMTSPKVVRACTPKAALP